MLFVKVPVAISICRALVFRAWEGFRDRVWDTNFEYRVWGVLRVCSRVRQPSTK